MKKLISLAAAALLAFPCAAFADGVLVDDWSSASVDELVKAKSKISAQVAQLLVHQEVPAEGFTLSGEGMDITDAYTLPNGYWRRLIKIPNAKVYGDQVTISIAGKNNVIKISDAVTAEPLRANGALNIDYAVVETDGSWEIEYTPITADGTLEASGDGGFVSNFFTCTKPTKVTFSVNNGYSYLTSFKVNLYYMSNSGYLCSEFESEKVLNELVDSGAQKTFTAIIKPEDKKAAYLWVIACDTGVEWSITAK